MNVIKAAVFDLDGTLLDLTEYKGRRYFVPATMIGFVHVGESEKGKVGFGAH